LQQAGLTQFQDLQKLIKELADSLHKQYELTNRHILNGTNTHIKFYKNGEFSLIKGTTPNRAKLYGKHENNTGCDQILRSVPTYVFNKHKHPVTR
jgi:hypothetical protein